jgi:hypothetical protein
VTSIGAANLTKNSCEDLYFSRKQGCFRERHDIQHNDTQNNGASYDTQHKRHSAQTFNITVLSAIMLSIIKLSVAITSISVMLSVVMLNVI